jgi:hypothetical protein
VDYHEELLFTDLTLFNRKLADWLVVSDAERPHHSLGQQSPLSFLLQHQPECQRYWTHTLIQDPKGEYARRLLTVANPRPPTPVWVLDLKGA